MKQVVLWSVAGLVILATAAFTILGFAPNKSGKTDVRFYQDSMHPWVRLDHPGTCPICGMALTPISTADSSSTSSREIISLSSNAITVANLQTATIRHRDVFQHLRVAGSLEVQEFRQAVVASPAAARVEFIQVDRLGLPVHQGDPLIRLFSPDLAQRARFWRASSTNRAAAAANHTMPGTNESMSSPMDKSSMEKGRGSMPDDMGTVNSGGFRLDLFSSELPAPIDGVITERSVTVGQYVMEGQKLMTVADLSILWFRFDATDRQLTWLREGQGIEVELNGVVGKPIHGSIESIEPLFDGAAHQAKVRSVVTNFFQSGSTASGSLRPGMIGEGRIKVKLPSILAAPRSAVIYPGHLAWVYVDHGGGYYERRRVKLGREGDDWWEILGGLKEGEHVVTTGNILLDSQSALALGDELSQDDTNEGSPDLQSTEMNSEHEEMGGSSMTSTVSPREPWVQTALELLDSVAGSLAHDNLTEYNQSRTRLKAHLVSINLQSIKPELQALIRPVIQALSAKNCPDIKAARAEFVALGSSSVTFAKGVDSSGSATGSIHVFHCPMAPKPGLWFQLREPLLNPFFGSSMQTCGEEVEIASVASRQSATNTQSSEPAGRLPQNTSLQPQGAKNPNQGQALTSSNQPPNTPQRNGMSVNPHADRVTAAMSARDELKSQIRARVLAANAEQENRPAPRLTDVQVQTIRSFLKSVDQIGRELAQGDVKGFNASIEHLPDHFPSLLRDVGMPPRWGQEWEGARVLAKYGHSESLASARTMFLPFSRLTVAFIRQLPQRDESFAEIHLFQSDQGNSHYVWIQLDATPLNPFGSGDSMPLTPRDENTH